MYPVEGKLIMILDTDRGVCEDWSTGSDVQSKLDEAEQNYVVIGVPHKEFLEKGDVRYIRVFSAKQMVASSTTLRQNRVHEAAHTVVPLAVASHVLSELATSGRLDDLGVRNAYTLGKSRKVCTNRVSGTLIC